MENYQKESEKIDTLINKKYPYDEESDIGPILDGVIDYEKYFSSKYKILWILKEPYDVFTEEGKPKGGCWDYRIMVNSKNSINDFGTEKKTFSPIIYTSYGLLNGFIQYDNMDDSSNSVVFNSLKQIAIINVKKLPGYRQSHYRIIETAYQDNKEILLKQIELCSPDIVIAGNTLQYFLSDLGIDQNNKKIRCPGSFPYYRKNNSILIAGYHPACVPRSTSEEDYCNDIINTIKSIIN